MQSPIGSVPKAGNKTRLIFHLSFDFRQGEADLSINHHTPKEWCTVKYNDLDSAVRGCLALLRQTSTDQLSYCKTDCSNAFRLLPVLVKQRAWLVLKAKHPKTKLWFYFIDKCLPFGSSISCALFQEFSDALKHLAQWRITILLKIPPMITNYLDDFLFAAITAILCNKMLNIFLGICSEINCPISAEKTEWATQFIIFLGILLNGQQMVLSVPNDKKTQAIEMLAVCVSRKKASVKDIQRLTGILNFLNRAIVPGRAFTRGMYQKLKLTNSQGKALKSYHHVNLGTDFISDCKVFFARTISRSADLS